MPYSEEAQEGPQSEATEVSTAEADRACVEMKTHLATARKLVEEARKTFAPETRDAPAPPPSGRC